MNRPFWSVKTARPDNRGRAHAFTLVELLVAIAVIGMLAALLLPTLAKAKAQAQAGFCLGNTKQLALGCLMYTGDNKERLPYNLAATASQTNINWVSDLLDWETNSDNTNLALLSGAALGSYVGRSPGVYHCPLDTALASIQQGLGWSQRARSYSMNASIGDAGEVTQAGFNVNNPGYIQFFTLTSIPVPSGIFVFLDEHPDTIYDGYFVNRAASKEWTRLPGSYHDGGANFSFADGHAELHRWRYAGTQPPSVPDGATNLATTLPADQRGDFYWVVQHMSMYGPPN